MKIKKGDRFLCIKDVEMDSSRIDYIKGKEYISEKDGCITDEEGDAYHKWTPYEWENLEVEKYEEHIADFNKYFKKLVSDNYVTHIEKGGKYKIITDSASFQVGDLWIRSVVYECLDNGVIYVREYGNFIKKFVRIK